MLDSIARSASLTLATKIVGFFSDAYCVEWTYAKAVLVRKQLARVLAEKVSQGQYDRDEALSITQYSVQSILAATTGILAGALKEVDWDLENLTTSEFQKFLAAWEIQHSPR